MNKFICILNFFKPKNWVYLISYLIDLSIIFFTLFYILVGNINYTLMSIILGLVVGAFIVFKFVANTLIGEKLFINKNGLREITQDKVYNIYKEELSNYKLKNVRLYLSNDSAAYAKAFNNIIVISMSACLLTDKQIKALINKALYEIACCDSFFRLYAYFGNPFLNVVLTIVLLPFMIIFSILDGIINGFRRGKKYKKIFGFIPTTIYIVLSYLFSIFDYAAYAISTLLINRSLFKMSDDIIKDYYFALNRIIKEEKCQKFSIFNLVYTLNLNPNKELNKISKKLNITE